MVRGALHRPLIEPRGTADSYGKELARSAQAEFTRVNDCSMALEITLRNTAKRMSKEYPNRAERRLAIVLGIILGCGFLIAAVIWWQLLL